MKKNNILLLSIMTMVLSTIISCKKVVNSPDSSVDNNDTSSSTSENSSIKLILDSVYLYAHQLYFWNKYIPSYSEFNPEQYADGSESDSLKLFNELFAFTVTYNSAINSITGRSYEYYADDSTEVGDKPGPKYSYFEQSTTNSSTSAIVTSSDYLEGNDYGFGFYPGIWDDTTILIRYVQKGSPFNKNGIQRGDRIISINNTKMQNNNTSINLINSLLSYSNNSSASFVIQRTRNNIIDTLKLTIAPANYTFNPVFQDTVITSNSGKKVGYVAYETFTDWDNSSNNALTSVFTKFADSSINELVVDLRYNGGGYVETSQKYADLIAPSSADGKTMYIEYFNDTMTSGKANLLAKQNYVTSASEWSTTNNTYKFSKLGNVSNLSRVIFLVSNNTASASELLINNLKPYMNVVLIGTQWEENSGDNTYGKPVGFFPLNIDKYTYYIPEFASGNATDPTGGATYYNGITVDNASTDDARYNFGNSKETAFAQALYYIDYGSFSSNYIRGKTTNKVNIKNLNLKNKFKQSSYFNGMLHNTINKKS